METDVRALGLNLPRSSGPILITSLSRTDATQRPDGERAIGKRLACNQAGADESDFPGRRAPSTPGTRSPRFVPAAERLVVDSRHVAFSLKFNQRNRESPFFFSMRYFRDRRDAVRRVSDAGEPVSRAPLRNSRHAAPHRTLRGWCRFRP